MSTHIAVSPKLEFEFDCLFQPFESPGHEISAYQASHGQSNFQIQGQRYVPVAFVLFQGRYTQKLIDGLLRIIPLHLLGVVVFILDPDISRLIVVRIFILEVISVIQSRSAIGCLCLTLGGGGGGRTYSSSPDSCMKSSSSDMVESQKIKRGRYVTRILEVIFDGIRDENAVAVCGNGSPRQ